MDIVHVAASWLHVLATVMVLGYYGVLGLVVVPVLRRTLDGPRIGATVQAVEQRALPWLVASVVVFVVTGTFLLLTDGRSPGLGQLFATTWAVLIVVKHLVVAAMVALGAVVDLLIVPDAALPETEAGRSIAVARLGRLAVLMTLLGGLVLLLTSAAQAS